jgi:hypothetical protein
VPNATALVLNHNETKYRFFSVIEASASSENTMLLALEAGKSELVNIDTGWLGGLWMVHQLGAGTYGYSVVTDGPLPAIAARTDTSTAVSSYRGISIYRLSERAWVGRYRNLWLAGTQPRLVEAMIGELKDRRRDWQVMDGTGIKVRLSNLPAFLSGMVTGALEAWLQRLATEGGQLRLSAAGDRGLSIRGQLEARTFSGSVPLPEAVAEYLPAQLAWCTGQAINILPERHPLYAFFGPWLGQHKVTAELAMPGSEADNRLVLLPVRQGDPSGNLAALSASLGLLESFSYQVFEVRQVLGDGLFSDFIPGGFQNPYLVVLGDYVAISASRRAIEQAMNARSLGLSLLQDEAFSRRIPLDRKKAPAAWWYCNHERSARLVRGLLLSAQDEATDFWTEWEATTAAVYNDGTVSLDSRLQEEVKQTAATLVWQTPLASKVVAGPFLYKEGLLAQEEEKGLVCRDFNGKVRWVYPLTDSLAGKPQPLFLDGGKRPAIAFAAGHRIHVVDWQGQSHPPYPLALPAPVAAPLKVHALEGQVVYGIWASSEDQRIYGFDQGGRFLPGWGPNQEVGTLVPFQLQHEQHDGKDYVVALSEAGKLHLFDRQGRRRLDALPLKGRPVSPPYLRVGEQQQRIAVGQADGYVQVFNLQGQTFRLSLMPAHQGEVQFLFEDVADDSRGDYLMWDRDELRLFTYKGNAFQQRQNWRLGEPLHSVKGIRQQGGGLLLAFSATARRLWALPTTGGVIEGFPVAADAPPALLPQNGRTLVLCYYEGSLYLYLYEL